MSQAHTGEDKRGVKNEVMTSNIYLLLHETATKAPNNIALVYCGQIIKYRELISRVERATLILRSWGLKAGDKVILAFGNTPSFCELFYACARLGILVVPFSSTARELEMLRMVEHVKPKALFYDDLGIVVPDLGAVRVVGLSSYEKEVLARFKEVPSDENIRTELRDFNPNCPCLIMYTSGTTGAPKGVMLTHNNLNAAAMAYIDAFKLSPKDSTLICTPIHHITGLSALLHTFITIGGKVVLSRRFNALEALRLISSERISFFHASPTVFILLLRELEDLAEQCEEIDLSHVLILACGAGHLNWGVANGMARAFKNASIHPVYGLTETTSPATIMRENLSKHGSSGTPALGIEISIRDDDFNLVKAGESGAIYLKGPMVIEHYYEGAPADAFRDGWFYSGDIGLMDADGYLYVLDRAKDLINRGGQKVYCVEVEDLISTFNGVSEVALIAKDSELYGEEPVAVVVAKKGVKLKEEEILSFLKGKISSYKIPVSLIFAQSLPLTGNGKINKRELRDIYFRKRSDINEDK